MLFVDEFHQALGPFMCSCICLFLNQRGAI